LNAVHRAAAGERDLEPVVVPEALLAETVTPIHWQVVPQPSAAAQSGVVALLIGMPRVASIAAPAPVALPESPRDRDVEKMLRQRESRLRSVLEVAPSGLLVLDEQGRPVFHNARAAVLLGRAMREGQSMEDWLAHSCRDDRHREEVVRLWREGVWRKQLTRTITLTAADGVLKEIELRPSSIPGGGMVVMLNDVTDERRSEELLRAMEAKFRALVHENPLPVVLCDRSGSVFEANAAAEDLTGRTRAELRGMAMEDWLAPESQTARSVALNEMVQRGDLFAELGVTLNHREGRPISASLRVAAVPDASGQPAGTVHFFQPVLPKPSAFVEEVEEQELPMESFLTLPSNVVLLATDYHGRVTEWSEEAEMCFGLTEADAMGRGLHTLFRPSDASGFYAELSTITAAGLTQPVEWMFLHPEHGRRTGRFMLQPSTVGGMAVAIVSEEEEEEIPEDDFMAASQEEEVAAMVRPAPDNAQQLERERYLVGETHHRVKNHLQIITSMLNLQLSMMQNSEAREALRSSQNRVRSIADLHQHLFGVAVGDVGSFAEFAKGLIGHLRDCYDMPEDRVKIELNIADSSVPDEWLMPLALSMNEMVSNAFKHAFPDGRSGSLKIGMKWSPESGELKVEDDGAGMPEDFEERHFTGLGMKILRVFAGQLGGEVRISSEPGRGSAFRLLFPKAEQSAGVVSPMESPPGED
jgi:PAS domain S-box-containing protein